MEQLFTVPLTAFLDPNRLRPSTFRDVQPCWNVRVGDLMSAERKDEGDMQREEMEIWGLSGWFMNELLRSAYIQQLSY